MTEQANQQCAICGEAEADRRFLHECFGCGRYYHLNPFNNRPGKDCGDAVMAEEFGLFYYCAQCLITIDEEYRAANNIEAAPGPNSGKDLSGLPPRTDRPSRPRRYRRIDRA